MVSAVFKDILVTSKLEEAAINQLVVWLPTYIREIERQLEITVGAIPYPKYYTNRNSFDLVPGEDWPKVVVISPGLADAPMSKGDGQYMANWRLGVGVGVAATTEVQANMLVKVYSAAVRAIFVHKQSLGGLAQAITWVDENYDDLPINSPNQLYKASATYFVVSCENVVTKWAGPEVPDDEPYAWGIVEKVIIDIIKEPVDA